MAQFINEARRFQKLAGIITENEEQDIINDPKAKKALETLAAALKANPKAAEEIEKELKESLNEEETEYADYTDPTPKPISKKEYWTRKLKTIGLGAAAAAALGVLMAGGVSADDALQMALGAAAGGGAISGTLISTVGKVKKEK
jgi:ferric-dicitrate binding protein FerR (iron transport regulator)